MINNVDYIVAFAFFVFCFQIGRLLQKLNDISLKLLLLGDKIDNNQDKET